MLGKERFMEMVAHSHLGTAVTQLNLQETSTEAPNSTFIQWIIVVFLDPTRQSWNSHCVRRLGPRTIMSQWSQVNWFRWLGEEILTDSLTLQQIPNKKSQLKMISLYFLFIRMWFYFRIAAFILYGSSSASNESSHLPSKLHSTSTLTSPSFSPWPPPPNPSPPLPKQMSWRMEKETGSPQQA